MATTSVPGYVEIVRVVHSHVDGFNADEVATFRGAFREDAWIIFTNPAGALMEA